MIQLPVYSLEGAEMEKVDLKDKPFLVEFKAALIHQVIVSLQNNQRIYTAHAKTRGEVRGGGKKPWKQKGTGRARAGSIRSPLWVGGGVTFGPRNNRNYTTKINKKVGRLALAMAFSKKATENEIKIVENWQLEKPKTKLLAAIFNKLGITGKSVLLVTAIKNDGLIRAASNLPKTDVKPATSISTLDLANYKFAIIEKEALEILKARITHDGKRSELLKTDAK